MAKQSKGPFIDGYKGMKALNQFIKSECDIYTVDDAGYIYMRYSGELGLEKIGFLTPDVELNPVYRNVFINSEKMFRFTKDARVSTLSNYINSDFLPALRDIEHNVEIELPQIVRSELVDTQRYLYTSVFHKAWCSAPHDVMLRTNFIALSDDNIQALSENRAISVNITSKYKGEEQSRAIIITRELFPNIKKCTSLGVSCITSTDAIDYIVFEEVYPICTLYSFTAFLQAAIT